MQQPTRLPVLFNLERLKSLFTDDDKGKLIAQAYNGASAMRGEQAGVQQKVSEHYENAHYLHCYAHQLNLIMQQATSQIPAVRFFWVASPAFLCCHQNGLFSTRFLLPRASFTRWNFNSRIVNTVYENLDDLIECFRYIVTTSSFDSTTVHLASWGYFRMKTSSFFCSCFIKLCPTLTWCTSSFRRTLMQSFIKEAFQNFTMKVQSKR